MARALLDVKLFADLDSDRRLSSRVMRDKKLGRDLPECLDYYLACSKVCFEEFTLPTKKYADLIIPRGPFNDVAVELIVKYLQEQLDDTRSQPLPNHPHMSEQPPIPASNWSRGSSFSEK